MGTNMATLFAATYKSNSTTALCRLLPVGKCAETLLLLTVYCIELSLPYPRCSWLLVIIHYTCDSSGTTLLLFKKCP